MSERFKSFLKITAFFAVGFTILYLVYYNQDKAYQAKCVVDGISPGDCSLLDKLWTDVSGANWYIILFILLFFMISNVSRALRWDLTLEPFGVKPRFLNSLGAIMVAYLTNLGIPRSGEFVRAGILAKYEDISAERAMGTIVTERIVDVICLLLMILLALVFSYDDIANVFINNNAISEKMNALAESKWLLVSIFGAGAFVLGVLFIYRAKLINSKAGQKIIGILMGFLEGIKSIFLLKKPWLFIFHSVVIWLMYYLMTYVAFFAFAPTANLSAVAGLAVFVFGTLGVVFPSPGGMGSYHFLIGEGLALYGVNAADGFSFANIVFFSVQIFCNVLFGLVAFIYLPLYNKNK